MLYTSAGCFNCHLDPVDRLSNIQRGVTVAALQASYRSVGSMNQYQNLLTAANNEDLAAYIRSRVAP